MPPRLAQDPALPNALISLQKAIVSFTKLTQQLTPFPMTTLLRNSFVLGRMVMRHRNKPGHSNWRTIRGLEWRRSCWGIRKQLRWDSRRRLRPRLSKSLLKRKSRKWTPSIPRNPSVTPSSPIHPSITPGAIHDINHNEYSDRIQ